jgi:hypothetical protein
MEKNAISERQQSRNIVPSSFASKNRAVSGVPVGMNQIYCGGAF